MKIKWRSPAPLPRFSTYNGLFIYNEFLQTHSKVRPVLWGLTTSKWFCSWSWGSIFTNRNHRYPLLFSRRERTLVFKSEFSGFSMAIYTHLDTIQKWELRCLHVFFLLATDSLELIITVAEVCSHLSYKKDPCSQLCMYPGLQWIMRVESNSSTKLPDPKCAPLFFTVECTLFGMDLIFLFAPSFFPKL